MHKTCSMFMLCQLVETMVTFSSDKNNPISELSYLAITLSRNVDNDDTNVKLSGTFDFRTVDAETATSVFLVGFRTAWLTLEYEGFKPILETRYGLQGFPLSTTQNRKDVIGSDTTNMQKANLSGGIKGPLPSVSSDLEASNAVKKMNTSEISSESTVCHVEPHGDQSWCFTGLDDGPLKGNLVPSVPIVELTQTSGNREHVRATVTVKQRDLWFERTDGLPIVGDAMERFSTIRHTKNKLAGIVLAKALANQAGNCSYSGKFIVSESIVSDSADETI